jgi:hypothetical protein
MQGWQRMMVVICMAVAAIAILVEIGWSQQHGYTFGGQVVFAMAVGTLAMGSLVIWRK